MCEGDYDGQERWHKEVKKSRVVVPYFTKPPSNEDVRPNNGIK